MAKPQTGRSRSRSSKPAPMKRKPQPKPQPKNVEVLTEMAIKMGALGDRIDRLERVYGGGAKEPLPSNKEEPVEFDEYFKLKSELESAVQEINDTEIIERGIEITGHAMVISRRMTDIFTNQISYK